ncbi:hypothetical protein L0222_01100 [bacterium]|nr:hypothetical protein [bacterium]MCI0601435.1 hypothetical protein [bacterium]
MINRLLAAIVAFWQSLFKKAEEPRAKNNVQDVDEVARTFYGDLLDSEKKRKR